MLQRPLPGRNRLTQERLNLMAIETAVQRTSRRSRVIAGAAGPQIHLHTQMIENERRHVVAARIAGAGKMEETLRPLLREVAERPGHLRRRGGRADLIADDVERLGGPGSLQQLGDEVPAVPAKRPLQADEA